MTLSFAPLVAAGWGVCGFAAGFGIRRLSVWLCRLEELEYGSRAWQTWGPPILAALLFAAFGYRFGADYLLLVKSLWVAVLVQVIFFDAEHRLILDRVMVPAMIAALVLSFVTPGLGFLPSLLTGLGAGLLFLLLALAGSFFFGADALGFGDVKLVAFIGLIVGVHDFAIVTALFLGVLFAGVVSLLLVIFRVLTMKSGIPYGPFLAAGALVVLYQLGAK
ncbi:MAG TPA: A24 family peptidase [Candidatus Dormibacteraeota bacterium]|nr:A24 family peptidase [Candidatus Dormibacteraeota bacterium]